ncbi:S1C family serine protease [Mesonia sp. K7]|uniref:S1C family serine protease n=1 Tax=Mesonia sp. K7 TaxID=2218606 RepID=UPI000DA86A29|nr:trypsin-like peptidase domain-containing protein [Mesonia sp. K7]PZD77907.1 serine protease [Mesonia sp. K7]
MKKISVLFLVALFGGFTSLGIYKYFIEENQPEYIVEETDEQPQQSNHFKTQQVSYGTAFANPDFTTAANKTVHAVVHVKNVSIGPRSIQEYMHGIQGKAIRGAGSGVIITQDGYIVTNNHVIQGASEIQVTLNNNITYKAKVIGTAPKADIALIKIDANDLNYLPFGNSDQVQLGEWVLAVGNPLNLTSTVTAGIVSAKGRDLNEGDTSLPSYIQTDAAINPGNSGGALVNTNGELIGINTAITSQTGSYIGYGFAVPSNNARKIVEDLLEYGDIQQAIIGITGGTLNPEAAKKYDLSVSQGVYVSSVNDNAERSGLRKGDLIIKIDGIRVRKMSDLTAYINTKRPGDDVQVNFIRDDEEKITKVRLSKYETIIIEKAGLEVTNADDDYLAYFDATYGVKIVKPISEHINIPQDQFIITKIDDIKVNSVDDVKRILNKTHKNQALQVTFKNRRGYEDTYTFRS